LNELKVDFNRPGVLGNELEYMKQAIENGHISGDGPFTKKCHTFLEKELGVPKALLTTSCTHALEMAAILLDIQPRRMERRTLHSSRR
jgi:dTDP-4-amino-4,6-dideoxygalactose transaminase